MDNLFQEIEAFDIDGGPVTLSFVKRLARENGWTRAFSRRVVAEYKKFVYLAMTAGHPVTPSEHVDQAWHLHLTYTQSYWERLNRDILPRPLHHNPTRGGSNEDAKFDDWYAKTLDSYRAAFGTEPPADIWPPSDQRFGEDLQWRRVNTAQNWVVPKRWAPYAVSVGILGIGTGCVPIIAQAEPFPVIPVVIGAILLIILIVGVAGSNKRRGASDSSSSGCGGGDSGWSGSDSGHHGGGHGHGHGDADGDGDGGGDGGDGGGGCGGGGCGGGGD